MVLSLSLPHQRSLSTAVSLHAKRPNKKGKTMPEHRQQVMFIQGRQWSVCHVSSHIYSRHLLLLRRTHMYCTCTPCLKQRPVGQYGNVIKTRIAIGNAVFSSVLLLIKPRAIRGLLVQKGIEWSFISVSLACDKKFELRSLCQKLESCFA